ncbi:hypothetical protein M7I_6865 [Glarea lozoyensis 74030]|uniref:Uncharacterized protein n=1 Tax=Glarea lozoyensis (strain ATCC 74030 / MF5533) TaxID=1104152 RepID=H0EVR1_GLAL7|nr:hypothetical protein M7I_6865 [Glarea lozoyensis 74030]
MSITDFGVSGDEELDLCMNDSKAWRTIESVCTSPLGIDK